MLMFALLVQLVQKLTRIPISQLPSALNIKFEPTVLLEVRFPQVTGKDAYVSVGKQLPISGQVVRAVSCLLD